MGFQVSGNTRTYSSCLADSIISTALERTWSRPFKVIKYSPGLEEYALILSFTEIRKKFSNFDFLVFDMPPTALALKFFTLPNLSLIWIEQLLILRQEIIKKRDIITKIKLIKKEVERDKILNKINEMKKDYLDLKTIFEDCKNTKKT